MRTSIPVPTEGASMSQPPDANRTSPPADTDGSVGDRLGALAQKLRAYTDAAALSFHAMKGGGVGLHGATSVVLESSLAGIRDLVDRTLAEARLSAGARPRRSAIVLDAFIEEVRLAAGTDAQTHGCELAVGPVPPGLRVEGDRPMLNAAISILLQNAFRYTRPGGRVCLDVRRAGDRIVIEVEDQCGGFPAAGHAAGDCAAHGLSIVRRAIDANGGQLSLRNAPGLGCAMSIDLPAGRGT
jgi:signal transduction histidine kinase